MKDTADGPPGKLGTALITGATSGIGRSYALALGRRGYRLILTGRRREKLEALKGEIEAHQPAAVELLIGDLREPETLETLIARVDSCEDLSFLIHNAGYGHTEGFASLSKAELNGMAQVHMEAAVELLHASIGRLTAPASVILVSSLAAFFPAPGPAMYIATKRFLIALGRSLHPELASRGVRTQVLCPGFTHTDFHDKLHWSPEQRADRGLVRWMRAEEVVRRSLAALERSSLWRDPVYVPGFTNRLLLAARRLLPYRLYARVARKT